MGAVVVSGGFLGCDGKRGKANGPTSGFRHLYNSAQAPGLRSCWQSPLECSTRSWTSHRPYFAASTAVAALGFWAHSNPPATGLAFASRHQTHPNKIPHMHTAQRLCHLRCVQVEVRIRLVGPVPRNSPPPPRYRQIKSSRVWIVVAPLFFLTVDVCERLRWKRD